VTSESERWKHYLLEHGVQDMTTEQTKKRDHRAPSTGKRAPRAVADAKAGMILAVADVAGAPESAFRALTTSEVEQWFKLPGVYLQRDWKADLRAQGQWSVTIELPDGKTARAWGEFCEINFPHKLVMIRRFDGHPFLGERETTLTYYFDPIPAGTHITLRDEGFIGRSEAASGNAEVWEQVLGWLDGHLSRAGEPG
jgi:uncharacterized protein YndB with AHSA1/START domain